MNVIFHVATAIGVAVSVADTRSLSSVNHSKLTVQTSAIAFVVGVISHGALDYIPHCYPINSKFDVIGGFIMILILVWLTRPMYRLITVLACLGAIFPDLIDLSLPMLNNTLGLRLPTFNKIFPWHWPRYTGSIYTGVCTISTLNHFLLVLMICMVCWCRKKDFTAIFGRKEPDATH